MRKTDILTRSADRLKEICIAPRIYNRDSIKECFVLAEKYDSYVIIRVNKNEFDLQETADLFKMFEKKYPRAEISLMAEGIETFEEAVTAAAAGYGGIALDDGILLNDETNMSRIKEITRAARAFDVSIQASVTSVEDLLDEKGYQMVKAAHLDMIKLMIGDINAENKEKYKHIIHVLRKETLSTLTLGEDTRVEIPMIKELAEAGISKWDVYEEYAAECVKALSNCYDAEPVKGKKLFMLELQNLLNSTFCQQADFLMHKSGHFVKR